MPVKMPFFFFGAQILLSVQVLEGKDCFSVLAVVFSRWHMNGIIQNVPAEVQNVLPPDVVPEYICLSFRLKECEK